MEMRTLHRTVFFVIAGFAVQGCGESGKVPEPRLDLVPVTGIVTMDGKALPDANVNFAFDGKPPEGFMASGGKTDSSGKFVVMTGSKPGTVPGRYKVTISRLVLPDGSSYKVDPEAGMDMEMLRMGGQLKELVPERYSNLDQTELSAAVAAGQTNQLEFKLSGS
jgi:hypothetical protein